MFKTYAESKRLLTSVQSRAIGRLGQISMWTFATFLAVVIHTYIVTRLQWDIHRGLGTSAFDVGLYDQGLWLLSQFEAPFVTLMGRNLFGDHASLILIFLTPIYWFFPGVETLLFLQAAVISAGAIPIYFYARRVLESNAFGFFFAVIWIVNPVVNGTNLENFHPEAFLGLLVPIALIAALEKKWRRYWIAMALCLLVKEDVVLLILPLGGLIALRGDKRRGLITSFVAISAAFAGMFLIMRNLIGVPTRNAWRIPFGGVGGFIKECLTSPTNVVRYLTSEERPIYLWKLFAPFAFMSFLAPEVAMVSSLVIFSNIVSTFWYQFHIEYHYSLIIVPALLIAVIVGLAKMDRRRRVMIAGLVAITSLLAGNAWSYVPFRSDDFPRWGANNPVALSSFEIMDLVPAEASISVFHSLAPHLTHRKEVYMFPNPFKIVMYGPDTSTEGLRSPLAEFVDFVVLPTQLDSELSAILESISEEFTVVASNENWQLLKHN